jgi:trans-aconitate 2-methyltransferase
MPRNFGAPMHALVDELALSKRWREQLADLVKPAPVASPDVYYGLLATEADAVEIWETEYLHVLTGERPVLEWIKGTWMRPFLDRLSEDDARAFEDTYQEHAAAAYPRRADGVTLLPFRRLFIVAIRSRR